MAIRTKWHNAIEDLAEAVDQDWHDSYDEQSEVILQYFDSYKLIIPVRSFCCFVLLITAHTLVCGRPLLASENEFQ